MRIGIIGAGNMGATLAAQLTRLEIGRAHV